MQIIGRRLVERRALRLADIDADRDARPSFTFVPIAQSVGNNISAVIVKTEPVNQRLLLGISEDAWFKIPGLRFCRHGSDLEKTESKRG